MTVHAESLQASHGGRILLKGARIGGIAIAAAGVGLLVVRSYPLAAGLAGVLLLASLVGARAAGVALVAVGFALGAAVTDSVVAAPTTVSGADVTVAPLKAAPYLLMATGAVLLFVGARRRQSRATWVSVFFALYLVAAAVGIVWSPTPRPAAYRLAEAAVPLVSAAAVAHFCGRSTALVKAVLAAAAWLVAAALFLPRSLTNVTEVAPGIERVGGVLHPALLAYVASCLLVFALWTVIEGRPIPALAMIALVVASAVALYQSRGRTGLVALGAMALVLLKPVWGPRLPSGRVGRRVVLATLAVTLAILAASFVRVWFVRGAPDQVDTLNGRLGIWRVALHLAEQHPWFGYGPGVFRFGGLDPHVFADLNGLVPPHAHDGFLEAALSGGFIGATFWLLAVIALGKGLFFTSAAVDRELILWRALFVGVAVNAVTEAQAAGFGFAWFLLVALTATLAPVRSRPEAVP